MYLLVVWMGFCLQRKHLALWIFHNMGFHGEALLAPRPTPKLEDHPSSAVRDCLFKLFAATLHIRGHSSICNLRTSHAVVTGTHLSHGMRRPRPWKENARKNRWEKCHLRQSLFFLYFVTQLTIFDIGLDARFSCWPILLRPRVCCCNCNCNLFCLPLNLYRYRISHYST